MSKEQIKQEVIEAVGQDQLKRYFDQNIDFGGLIDIVDETLEVLDITEDYIDELIKEELTQHEKDCLEFDATYDKYEKE